MEIYALQDPRTQSPLLAVYIRFLGPCARVPRGTIWFPLSLQLSLFTTMATDNAIRPIPEIIVLDKNKDDVTPDVSLVHPIRVQSWRAYCDPA